MSARSRVAKHRLGEPRPGEPHRVREREAARAGERVPRDAELGGGGGGPREDAVEYDGFSGVEAQEVGEERREEVNGGGERAPWAMRGAEEAPAHSTCSTK